MSVQEVNMRLSLPARFEKLIEERVQSGKYKTPEDVVAAALSNLEQQEQAGEFAAGELDTLLQEGEAGGESLDGEQVLAELRELGKRDQKKTG
jgi:putative addiction module CopG family antidote